MELLPIVNFKELPAPVQSLMTLLALSDAAFLSSHIRSWLVDRGMSGKEASEWMKKLKEDSWLEPLDNRFEISAHGFFVIAESLAPEKLETQREDDLPYPRSYIDFGAARAVLIGLSKCFRRLSLTKQDQLRLEDYAVTMLLRRRSDILMKICMNPSFEPLMAALPESAVEDFFHQLLEWAQSDMLMADGALDQLLRSLQASSLGEQDKHLFADEFVLRQTFVTHGKPRECLGRMHPDTAACGVMEVILLLQEGRDDEAVRQIKSIRKACVGTDLFDHYLDNFVLGAALYRQKNRPAVYRSLAAIAAKCRAITGSDRGLALQVICDMALHQQVSEDTLRRVKSVCQPDTPASTPAELLLFAVCLHFHILSPQEAGINVEACRGLSEIPNSPKFIGAQLLAALELNDEAQQLYELCGVRPLLPPFAKKARWESLLDSLTERCGMLQKKGKPSGEAAERIVYQVIPETLTIIPVLQKSRNGAAWSKGRSIALSNFRKAEMPCMQAADRSVALLTRKFMNWDGASYELGGAEALLKLAGCDRVFNADKPGQRFDIQTAPLVLTVTKNGDGSYTPSANLGPKGKKPDLNAIPSVIVQSRTDQGITLTPVSDKQRGILQDLLKIQTFPPESKDKLSAFLSQVCPVLPVVSDLLASEAAVPSRKGSSLVTFRVTPAESEEFLIRADVFPMPGVEFACRPGEGRESLFLPTRDGQVQVLRDLKLERQHYRIALSELSELGSCMEGQDRWRCGLEECLDFLGALQRCPPDSIRIEWPAGEKFSRAKGLISFGSLRVSASRSGSWLELGGEVEVDGTALLSVSRLLEAIRTSKGRYVQLSENRYAEISEALKKRLRAISALARAKKGKLDIPTVTAPFLQELRQEGASISSDRAADALFERVEAAERLYPKIPRNLCADLRDYQVEGYRWMSRLASWGAGACLADDMGLGKTLQAIALLLSRSRDGAAIVVMPASVLYNWKSELGRFAPGLRCVMLGSADREKTVRELGPGDVLLTTYGLLASESELLAGRHWHTAVLDEAHMIRNRGTKTSQAARGLDAGFRLILTGTPVQNNLSEIWSLFEFINPGLLGSFESFTERFITPIETRSEQAPRQTLRQIISPFLLRRTKASVLEELPRKTEITLPVELSAPERALYEKIRSEALIRAEEKETSTMDLLATLMKLRQAACSPKLIDPSLPIESSKQEAFMGLVRSLIEAGHRALVFSQFTSHLALIRGALDKTGIRYLYMDGAVRASERASLAAEFQKGEPPLFLISLKAGGTGLNLTAADYVIHLDPWWNPAVEDQASDRAYRIGQNLPVTIYRLIAKDTVEERILELHRTKKQLSDALLEGTDAPSSLTREDILRLLEQPAQG